MSGIKLFVGGLSYSTGAEVLGKLFETVGIVKSATIATNENNQSRGHGLVEMETPELAMIAVSKLNGFILEGRPIHVHVYRESSSEGGLSGRGRGRGFGGFRGGFRGGFGGGRGGGFGRGGFGGFAGNNGGFQGGDSFQQNNSFQPGFGTYGVSRGAFRGGFRGRGGFAGGGIQGGGYPFQGAAAIGGGRGGGFRGFRGGFGGFRGAAFRQIPRGGFGGFRGGFRGRGAGFAASRAPFDPNAPLSKTRVYIKNIPYELSSQDLQAVFTEKGFGVKEVAIAQRRFNTAINRGFGFVEFNSEEEQARVLKELGTVTIKDRPCVIVAARPIPDHTPAAAAGAGGGNPAASASGAGSAGDGNK